MSDESVLAGSSQASAFIFLSGSLGIDWTSEAYRSVERSGIVPYFYDGLKPEFRGLKVDHEARADLDRCNILILATTSEEAEQPTTLWIYPELQSCVERRMTILAYVRVPGSPPARAELVTGVSISCVNDAQDFGRRLRADLEQIPLK